MKKLIIPFFALVSLVLLSWTNESKLAVGDVAPNFKLKNVNNELVDLSSYKTKGAIVIFTCNHCPYAKAYENRIIQLQEKYKDSYPVIAINPNDPTNYPEDSFEGMVKQAKKKNYTFPYLHDESQEVAKAYGALKTPHVYLLQKEGESFVVKYIGAIDNNTYAPQKANEKYVERAIRALDAGAEVQTTTTKAIGCSIKWKESK